MAGTSTKYSTVTLATFLGGEQLVMVAMARMAAMMVFFMLCRY